MIVTFKTRNHPNITMFGNVAVRLLRLLGHSGTVPGALAADEVAGALERLRQAVAAEPDAPTDEEPAPPPDADGNREPPITLHQRAYPLMQLLETAAARGDNVRWD